MVKEFEDRMIQRIERDFYSQGKNLKETDTPPNFISNSTKKTENDNIKKRKFQDNEITKELPLKKTKFYVNIIIYVE